MSRALALLGAAAEQDHDGRTVFSEIHAQAGAEVDPRFEHPAADALHTGEVALLNPGHRGEDAGRRRVIEVVQPFPEGALPVEAGVLSNRDHQQTWSHMRYHYAMVPKRIRSDPAAGAAGADFVAAGSLLCSRPDNME